METWCLHILFIGSSLGGACAAGVADCGGSGWGGTAAETETLHLGLRFPFASPPAVLSCLPEFCALVLERDLGGDRLPYQALISWPAPRTDRAAKGTIFLRRIPHSACGLGRR